METGAASSAAGCVLLGKWVEHMRIDKGRRIDHQHFPFLITYTQSACNANCKRYAKELEQQNCTVLGGTARSRCEYRVKAFKYGCLSICALPSA